LAVDFFSALGFFTGRSSAIDALMASVTSHIGGAVFSDSSYTTGLPKKNSTIRLNIILPFYGYIYYANQPCENNG